MVSDLGVHSFFQLLLKHSVNTYFLFHCSLQALPELKCFAVSGSLLFLAESEYLNVILFLFFFSILREELLAYTISDQSLSLFEILSSLLLFLHCQVANGAFNLSS